MDSPKFTLFGTFAKSLRDNRHLSLADVANRYHTDKANIYRIESGVARPLYETVERLAKALEVTPGEAIELYERAGYQPPMWPTEDNDFAAVFDEIKPNWLSGTLPATAVVDVYWTVWYANASFAKFFSGGDPSQIVGTHYLKLCFDPSFQFREAMSHLAEDEAIEEFLTIVLARVRRRLSLGQGGASWQGDIDLMTRVPGFKTFWERAAPGQVVRGDTFTGHIRIQLRDGGAINVSSAPAIRDRRFFVVQYLPTDEQSARALAEFFRK